MPEDRTAVETSREDGTVKVAVVGGGCAGMAAAWHLAKLGGYEVHVYERSFRLGGKGASVRDAHGHILEHGLHVWLGFYENAFRMMRECYAEVEAQGWGPGADAGRKLAHGSLWDAFLPEPNIGVAGPDREGRWTVWTGYLPPEKGLPGDDLDVDGNPFTLASYVVRGVHLVKALMQSIIARPGEDAPGAPRPAGRSRLDEERDRDLSFDATRSPSALVERAGQLLRAGVLTTAAGVLQAVTILEQILQELDYAPQVPDTIMQLVEAIVAQARTQLRDLVSIDPAIRWKTEIIDIVMTIVAGLYRDRVLLASDGLDAINHLDYRRWLLQHGATHGAVESRFIRGIYDLVFAYEGGDRDRPALAAGVALRGALRMFFTYRGSMFWRMRSGMGDAVFAPLYRVLLLGERRAAERGGGGGKVSPATFHFGHALSSIAFDFDERHRRHVSRLVFRTAGRAAELEAYGRDALDRSGCWRDRADARFADLGAGEEVSLDVGRDFDAVVFALGVDDLVEACREAPGGAAQKASPFQLPHWRRMRENVKTVATRSAQVWLRRDLEELGWYRGSGLVTALGPPFETWADMTHTVPAEQAWRRNEGQEVEDGSRSVAYFCGVAADGAGAGGPAAAGERVAADLRAFLRDRERGVGRLWPAAFDRGGTAESSVIAMHAQANTAGSERYTLSLPDTLRHRISPLDGSVVNMTIAGDWTACGLDAGCVEAAVMSGMLASHAISRRPALDAIVGYNHP